MKVSIKYLIACMCFVTSAYAVAGAESTSELSVINDGTIVKVIYRAEFPSKVKVSIRNAQNKEVYAEVVTGSRNFLRPYNMKNLPAGEYTFEVSDGNEMHRKVVNTKSKNADERSFHIVKVTGAKNKYLLTIGKKNNTNVNIEVFDTNNAVIYTKSYSADEDTAEILNLEKVKGSQISIRDSNGAQKVYSL